MHDGWNEKHEHNEYLFLRPYTFSLIIAKFQTTKQPKLIVEIKVCTNIYSNGMNDGNPPSTYPHFKDGTWGNFVCFKFWKPNPIGTLIETLNIHMDNHPRDLTPRTSTCNSYNSTN